MAIEGFGDEHAYVGEALPTPSNTPYRTPSAGSRSRSQRSSYYDASSIGPSSSPPPLPPDHSWSNSNGTANEDLSALDPRRFTPTLHANLVAEILSLRRDLEARTGSVESLETALHTTRTEYETLNTAFSSNAKETRSLKRQLQLLEGGTSSALGELARERDEAVDNVTETKRRLEVSQRKLRTQEEEAVRAHDRWERDQQGWDSERRNLERKVHVVEGRLKAIIEEVAMQQAAAQTNGHAGVDSEAEEASKDSGFGHGSDSGSIRSLNLKNIRPMSSMSVDEQRHVRLSTLSGLNGFGGAKLNGLSLADELEMDEEDEDQDEENHEPVPTHDVVPAVETPPSKQTDPSTRQVEAQVNGVQSIVQSFEAAASKHPQTAIIESASPPSKRTSRQNRETIIEHKVEYVDTGVQFSPPPSPMARTRALSPEPSDVDKFDTDRAMSPTSIEANQRRKRTSGGSTVGSHGPAQLPSIVVPSPSTMSASCQTTEIPPSPPKTPKSPDREAPLPAIMPLSAPQMMTSSTQTDPPAVVEPSRPNVPHPIIVPSIAIHPPNSSPPMSGKSVLPPQTKNAACQASMKAQVKLRSISIQTEEIRIDQRNHKLPANLLPSAISSKPGTPEPGNPRSVPHKASTLPSRRGGKKALRDLKDRNVSAPPSSPPVGPNGARFPANDDGPLRSGKTNKIKRPFRNSSLFAGFEAPSSDEADDFAEAELSDNDYRTPLSAPNPMASFPRPPVPTNADAVSRWSADSQSQAATENSSEVLSSQRSSSNISGSAINRDSVLSMGLPIQGRRPSMDRPMMGRRPSVDRPIMGGRSSMENRPIMGRRTSMENRPIMGRRTSMDRPMQRFRQSENPLTSNPVKPLNIRKTALISSGAAAHTQQRAQSPSSRKVSEDGALVKTDPIPPFPVPTRSSSRRIPISASDGGRSPTRKSGSSRRDSSGPTSLKRDHLRKVRSAAAIPRRSRQRSDSLAGSSTFSATPESPSLPHLPQIPPLPKGGAALASQYQQALHLEEQSQRSRSTSITGAASLASSVPQTSVVDAISQTMVGEWMWKYVRKRKSFGVPESPPPLDTARTSEDGTVNITGNGTRHKRWVWLAPYDRAVVWSSRQPTSGTALLGKNGRKLNIQSVLDVRDDTPMPKTSTPQPHFNRSIIILTPTRALKFTAFSKERHYVWLTALSFLSHSASGINELSSAPPPPKQEYEPPPRQANVLRRNPIRDSIRVAKGKNRPMPNGSATSLSRPTTVALSHQSASTTEVDASFEPPEVSGPAADPPVVPRFLVHGRRRSNTGPRAPSSAFRSFTGQPIMPPSNHSFVTLASSDNHSRGQISPTTLGSNSNGILTNGLNSGAGSFTGRTAGSEASGPSASSVNNHNFFESVGTVRMEAFVKRSAAPPPIPGMEGSEQQQGQRPHANGAVKEPRPSSRRTAKSAHGGSARDKKHGTALKDTNGNHRAVSGPERAAGGYHGDDPFRGF